MSMRRVRCLVWAATWVWALPAQAAPDGDRLIFRSIQGGQERTLDARPALPGSAVRERFSSEASWSWPYRANQRGMPANAAELRAMNQFEQTLRAGDPGEESFMRAFCETGNGVQRCVYYVKDRNAFLKAFTGTLPAGVSFSGFRDDTQWTALTQALRSARR
jgi:hypothetical protein